MSKPAASKFEWWRPRTPWFACLVVATFAVFALTLIFTKRPWVDEAWFTGPALDIVTRGEFGTLLLDPTGSHLRLFKPDAILQGINERTYWVMPLHLLQLAAWGKLFGFTVFSMRMPSLLWGGVALASTFSIVRRLAGPGAALIAVAVLAVDFGFVTAASDARMDMTCAALGLVGLAVFLRFREAHFSRAVFSAHALTAAAVFTHPNGVFWAAGLLLTMLWLDRNRIRPLTVACIAAPYLSFGSFWAIYCLQGPGQFAAQFSANAASRASDVGAPWRGIWREINDRYRTQFWPEDSTTGKLKLIGILCYMASLGVMTFSRELRRDTGCRLLLSLTLLQFLCLSLLASTKNTYYLIHILPYFAAATGIAAVYLWSSYGTWVRILCISALACYTVVQAAAMLNLSMVTAGYRTEYAPAVAYLKSTMRPDDLIMGSAELGYSLGFYNPKLVDDVWLGYWSGRRPTVVVVDNWYYKQVMDAGAERGIPTPEYFDMLRRDFTLAKESKGYRIYRRKNERSDGVVR